MRPLTSILILLSIAFSQGVKSDTLTQAYTYTNKINIYSTYGLFDYRTGWSLYGRSITYPLRKDHEIFAAIGTSLFLHTLSVGSKFNLNFQPSFFDNTYAAISIRAITFSSQTRDVGDVWRVSPSLSAGIEKNIFTSSFLALGFNAYIDLDRNNNLDEIFFLPTINVSRRW